MTYPVIFGLIRNEIRVVEVITLLRKGVNTLDYVIKRFYKNIYLIIAFAVKSFLRFIVLLSTSARS